MKAKCLAIASITSDRVRLQFDSPCSAFALSQGVSQDYEQALSWFRKAADQGNAEARGYISGMKYDWHCGAPQEILHIQIQGDSARINNLSLRERESFGGGLRVIEFKYSIVNRRVTSIRVNAELAGFDGAGNVVIALRAGPMMDMVGGQTTETAHGDTYASEGELRKIQKLCVRFVGDF
jgi:TPR repeat protein